MHTGYVVLRLGESPDPMERASYAIASQEDGGPKLLVDDVSDFDTKSVGEPDKQWGDGRRNLRPVVNNDEDEDDVQ